MFLNYSEFSLLKSRSGLVNCALLIKEKHDPNVHPLEDGKVAKILVKKGVPEPLNQVQSEHE